jgi:hypothetical protein
VIGSFAVEGASGSWTLTVGGAPPVAGCTDAGAPNYDADAEVDDGSCEAYCGSSDCGAYLDMGYSCFDLIGYGYDCSLCEASGTDCSFPGCSDTQWQCETGDQCIPAGYVCDGSSEWGNAGWGPDCADGSDENFDDCCAAGSYEDSLCNPPSNCEDETACNTGAEGDCEFAATGTNCDGSCADGYENDCSGACASSSTIAGWQGDGWCDDGAYGLYLDCCDFNMDDGDCGDAIGCDDVASDCGGLANDDCGDCGGDNSSCADCAGVANGDSFADCAGTCLGAGMTSWIGDGYCDDGAFGVDYVSCGGFNCDDGDCGTELIDGSCQASGCADDQFTCANGDCIPGSYACDGSSEWGNAGWGPDCSDGSDELFDECCDAGAYADDLCNPPPTCSDITLVVGGGSWDSEISWDLSDGSSGAAGTFALCLEDGDYTFNGYDAYSDGWNGGSATFTDADGAVIASFAVEGASGSWTVTIGGAPPVAGCTDAGAPNYDADAEVDDGSCDAYCGDGSGCGGYINYGYTCEELVGYGYDCDACYAEGACPTVSDCEAAGGNDSYLGDGWCDGVNNQEACGFDSGDCCPGDCVSGTYDCATYGGDCDDCANPGSADLAEGGQCADTPPDTTCDDCEFDWTAYGAECCDAAAADFGLSCAALEGGYGWDCAGCGCPLDACSSDDECADGQTCEGYSCVDPPVACEGLTVTMCDSYGDGWNGNILTIGDQAFEPVSGDPCEDACYDGPSDVVVTCDGGSWQSEVSWTIGDELAGGAPYSGCLGNCDSAVFGCTDMEACNYNADATDDDGTCYGADCDGVCDSGAVEDDCGECGGDGSACAGCAYPNYFADGWCDGSNNTAECNYDGGDCCPGDCVDNTYSCEQYGGDCLDCANPDSADNNDGGECFEMALGCTDPYADNFNADANTDDGSCLYNGCAAGSTLGCSEQDIADSDCAIDGWIGDGYCDGYAEAYGINFCCFDLDGGDCTEEECSAPAAWDASITGLSAEGVDFVDYYYVAAPAVQWDWDDLGDGTSCGEQGLVECWDGSCAEDEYFCPEAPACEFDWSNYGSPNCDTAWTDFGINCAALEANYGWDCAGCDCPGDDTTLTCEDQGMWDCGDGQCIPTSYVCDGSSEFCNAGWGPDCANGADEGLDACGYDDECEPAGDDGGGEDCVNDDSTSDSYGDTCSSWYDSYESPGSSGCNGNYDDDDFSAATQCCACQGDARTDGVSKRDKPSSINTAIVDPSVMINALTGEMTYSDDAANNANRDVSYSISVSCDACLDGEAWSAVWGAATSDFLVYGFDDGSEVCASVTGISTELGVTEASGEACAAAGLEEVLGCTDPEANNYDESANTDDNSCEYCSPGDVNGDAAVNVLDIVATVNYILEGGDDFAVDCADINGDGAVNVLDIVATVNFILEGRTVDASSVRLIKAGNALNLNADGYIGGVQMTLSHGADFSIELTDKAMVADYRTNGNETTLIIVAPESDELFIATGKYDIVDMIVANSAGQMDVSIVPSSFELSAAYPNPFNPTTSLNLSVAEAGHVSVQVYNVMGQLVSTLADGHMGASEYTFTWDASAISSGVYLITATTANHTSTQKVMLLK